MSDIKSPLLGKMEHGALGAAERHYGHSGRLRVYLRPLVLAGPWLCQRRVKSGGAFAFLCSLLVLYWMILSSDWYADMRVYSLSHWQTHEPEFTNVTLPSALSDKFPGLLAHRLHSFLGRPVKGYSEAIEENELGCPNKYFPGRLGHSDDKNKQEFWERLSVHEIVARRSKVVEWFEERLLKGQAVLGSPKTGGGRGIVLTCGNHDTVLRATTLLKHLRRLGNTLPIEIFHYPGELTDHEQREELIRLGASLIEATSLVKNNGAWKDWHIKGLAILQSGFRELVYLDSDNIPLRTLEHLFEAPLYRSHGAVFYPDIFKDLPSNAIWRIVGDTCHLKQWSFESGQIIIDKAGNHGLNLAALIIAASMQAEDDFWYHMCGGDKDTFRWAFRMLDIPWSDSPRMMSTAGFENAAENGRFCGHTTVQYDIVRPKGQDRELPLFAHSNLLKHIQSSRGLEKGLFTHIKRFQVDDYYNPILNHAHIWVYDGRTRGMCLDMEWQETAQNYLTPDVMEASGPVQIAMKDIAGQPFDGFEDAFIKEGGRIGGW